MSTEDKVKKILSSLSGEEDIKSETSLQNDLALDSLAMVALLVEIEDTFNIELDESDMNPFDFTTVQSVINMLKKYCD